MVFEVVPLEQILHMHTFLLSYDPVLLLVFLLSLDQSPAQEKVILLPAEPLERLGMGGDLTHFNRTSSTPGRDQH